MNKNAKSSHRNKRPRKQPAQAGRKGGRPPADKAAVTHESRRSDTGPRAGQHDEYENKRRLWERKQAELEARWTAAQAKRSSEEDARRRTAKMLRGATGIAALAILLCALVLYYAYGIHIPGLTLRDGA